MSHAIGFSGKSLITIFNNGASTSQTYGPFAIERGETAKKFFFELMLFLDLFQYKNHIWHINKNFIFLAVSPLSIARGPFSNHKRQKLMGTCRISTKKDRNSTFILVN